MTGPKALFAVALSLLPTVAPAQTSPAADPEEAILKISCTYVYPDGGTEYAGSGTGTLINSFGNVLTARHVLAPVMPDEKTRLECVARRKSIHAFPFPITVEPTTYSLADVIIGRFWEPIDNKFPYLGFCDANALRSESPPLTTLGFPLDANVTTEHFQIRNRSGAMGTWTVGGSIVKGYSGGPVLNADNNIVGILVGGQDFTGYNNMVPEYIFRNMVRDLAIASCQGDEGQFAPERPSPPKPREWRVPFSFLYDDHEPLSRSSRTFTEVHPAPAGCTITTAALDLKSEANSTNRALRVHEDGQSLEIAVTLRAGPAYDRWRGWAGGDIVAELDCAQTAND